MTSSNGNIFLVSGHLCGEFTGPGEFPAQRPVTRSFDVFFDLRPNKRLSKQSWGWWFGALPRPLWRHSNDIVCKKWAILFLPRCTITLGCTYVNMVVADALAPNRRQATSSHHAYSTITGAISITPRDTVISLQPLNKRCSKIGRHVTNPLVSHDDVIKWKHFPRYWPFVWGIHRSPVNSPHKGKWRGALMCSLISAWINYLATTREASDLRRHGAHYGVTVMSVAIYRFILTHRLRLM